jgi:hypothetical protein
VLTEQVKTPHHEDMEASSASAHCHPVVRKIEMMIVIAHLCSALSDGKQKKPRG